MSEARYLARIGEHARSLARVKAALRPRPAAAIVHRGCTMCPGVG
jgi:hypothetical protein